MPPKQGSIFPHISRIYPARFGLLGFIVGVVTGIFLVQTLQTNSFDVLGVQSSRYSVIHGFSASESTESYLSWREKVRNRPDWRDGWIMAGKLALEAGLYDEALIAVNHALLLDPNHEESSNLAHEILDALGKSIN